MNLILVRLAQPIHIGKEVQPDALLERGRNYGSSQLIDMQPYDATFLMITLAPKSAPADTYSQLIPWAQVGTVLIDDATAKKSKGGKGSKE